MNKEKLMEELDAERDLREYEKEQKEKKFNLSEKIRYCSDNATRKCITGLKQKTHHAGYIKIIEVNDVEEFIRRLKEELTDIKNKDKRLIDIVDKLAGLKLL